MPPLSMFGRHWRISSDDFVCPALAEFVVRVSWIFILVFVFIFHIQVWQCFSNLNRDNLYLFRKLNIWIVSMEEWITS